MKKKKQRHYFTNKDPSSLSYGFSSSHVVMWELDYKENWAPKHWWFWTVVLEKTLESPWTARRSNQSILKEISPEYSLEGLMLKLKLQYFGHLMWRTDSFEKTLMLWNTDGRRRRGCQRMRWLDGITSQLKAWVWVGSGSLMERETWHAAVHWVAKSQTRTEWEWMEQWVSELNGTEQIYLSYNSSNNKESVCSAGDLGLIPGLRWSSGEANGNPLQYSCLENPMDRGAWWAIVIGVAKGGTGLSV